MHNRKRILAVDDEPNMRRLLEISLRQAGYQAVLASDGKEALDIIRAEHIDLVVSDLHMPSMNGLALLKAIRNEYDHLPLIMVTAQGEISTAVEAMKLGAKDYILRPFDLETLEIAIEQALNTQRLVLENAYFKEHESASEQLLGNSPEMIKLKQLISQVAPTKASVLITGETGTGKEVIAQTLHQQSDRSHALFIAVNCAAIPADMLESELFGHEKGAFTGAIKERIGKFELSDNGTLFLDEITEMPIQLQSKLLRALQEGSIEKLGGNKKINLDLRIIAATNLNPLDAVKNGKLREDLYYRLNVFTLNSPALSAREGDVALLAKHFAHLHGKLIHDAVLSALAFYPWPGNVRELQNVIERAAIICANNEITLKDLPNEFTRQKPPADPNANATEVIDGQSVNRFSIPAAIQQQERRLIASALAETRGNKAKAAKLLEISERSLWNKLHLYNIH